MIIQQDVSDIHRHFDHQRLVTAERMISNAETSSQRERERERERISI
jgi:hypothetical protein